ncbi:MAG: TlpA disulfide reductase family protein, partial [Parabacteroides sp.]|nr:TlpA disulfide reductase family protein [Parabacteroides sp.]
RREMPNLVEVYKQYKAKGFEIVGVSLDSKQDAWEKGIKDLNITWPQLSDLQGWKNSGAALYYVNSIPHTILVDKDGTIVAKNLHGEEIAAKVAELLK